MMCRGLLTVFATEPPLPTANLVTDSAYFFRITSSNFVHCLPTAVHFSCV
jgi:hypothetical protein